MELRVGKQNKAIRPLPSSAEASKRCFNFRKISIVWAAKQLSVTEGGLHRL